MSAWTPENITALIAALTALAGAVGALIHSRNTRKQMNSNPPPPPPPAPSSRPPGVAGPGPWPPVL